MGAIIIKNTREVGYCGDGEVSYTTIATFTSEYQIDQTISDLSIID